MKCASALSTTRNTESAILEVQSQVLDELGDEPADLALIFSSIHHADALGELAAMIRSKGLGRHVLGCTGESIIGGGQEIEGATALCLWSIRLPNAELRPVRLTFNGTDIEGWPEETPIDQKSGQALMMLGDPFSFPADRWVQQLNEALPGLPIVGGMASAGSAPGQNRLILDDVVYEDGAVGFLLDGPFRIRTVVSQGCRPIGRPFLITKADRNLIQELGRRPAVTVLQEVFEEISEEEQAKVRQGLHVGRVINEYQESFDRGDFLVRNVIGADESGGIAITDLVRVGQTVQFHVRDAESADEDLRSLLNSTGESRPKGALLFSCNGRGTRMFPSPNHDVATIQEIVGPIPVAGFFAMGEIGPIGGQNFLHGFTASIALFDEEPTAE